jgi:hypothetical protein
MKLSLFTILFTVLVVFETKAYETDQYLAQFSTIEDSTKHADKLVNDVIKDVASRWEGKKDEYRFTQEVQRVLWKRQMERWLNENPKVDKYENYKESVFTGVGYFDSPAVSLKGLAPTVSIGGTKLGTDKFSHFFGMGGWYYEEVRHLKKQEDEVLKLGIDHEEGTQGEVTTGVYSNADLVANYEGMQFFKSISEDGISGKPSIITWEGDKPVFQRPFTFSDHINDYWDESKLPNRYINGEERWASFGDLDNEVLDNMRFFVCEKGQDAIEKAYEIKNENKLKQRYKLLSKGFKDGTRFKADKVCDEYWNKWTLKERIKFRNEHKAKIEEEELKKRLATQPMDKYLSNEELVEKYSHVRACNGDIRKAALEHDIISEWDQLMQDFIGDKLRKVLGNCYDYFREIRGNEHNNLTSDIMNVISSMGTDQVTYVISDKKILIKKDEIEGLKDQIIETKLQIREVETGRVCLNTVIPLTNLEAAEKIRTKGHKIVISNCYERDPDTGLFENKSQYKVTQDEIHYEIIPGLYTYKKWEGANFFSIDGFYEFNDKVGYIYRNINYLCKWY